MTAAAQWPRRGSPKTSRRPDLEALTGLRSGKPHHYPEYRIAAERLRRVIQALERISGALVRTMEGSEALVRAVVDAAAEHLSAEWVVFALVEGELPDVQPRHLVRGPDGDPPAHVGHHVEQVRGARLDDTHDEHQRRHHLHVPIRLDGRVVGGFAAWTPNEREIEDTDHSVLRILAGHTAAALQNCALLDHSARLHTRTARQAADLKARNDELVTTQAELGAARQREVLDDERHRIARELHDSVTQYALSAGMHIELVRSEIGDDRLRAQLDTAKDLTRRASSSSVRRSTRSTTSTPTAKTCRPCCAGCRGCTCPTSCRSRSASAGSRSRWPPSASSRSSASRARPCSTRRCTQRRAGRSCGWRTRAAPCGSRSATTHRPP